MRGIESAILSMDYYGQRQWIIITSNSRWLLIISVSYCYQNQWMIIRNNSGWLFSILADQHLLVTPPMPKAGATRATRASTLGRYSRRMKAERARVEACIQIQFKYVQITIIHKGDEVIDC